MNITLSNMPALSSAAAMRRPGPWALTTRWMARWATLRRAAVQKRLDRQLVLDAELVRQMANGVRKSHPGFAADLQVAADRAVHQAQGGR